MHLTSRTLFRAAVTGGALLIASVLIAGDTQIWSVGSYEDFEKGVAKNLSSRSDGLLTLAPRSREVFDASAAYLWALAQDSKGVLYAGGGSPAKLYSIAADGAGKTIAEFEGLEVHSIAIDARDRVYAGTSPDGKVYRITDGGKPEVFYDPKAKYIWALAFDARGNPYVATGDRGEIHRVAPDGSGQVFYRTEETHARSLAFDGAGNLIAGTEPGGLVIRVSPAGEGFVLYQMPKREVTAVAVARDGSIFAASVGTKPVPAVTAAPTQAPAAPAAPTQTGPVPGSPPTGGQAAVQVRTVASPPPSAAAPAPAVSGGSEVYRIDAGGTARRVWSSAQDVVYGIAFDSTERALLGAGNKGSIYRIESPTVYTALLTEPATQVTSLVAGRGGRLYAVTGNPGKVYEIGPGLEPEGTLESNAFDASIYSLWGRLSFEAKPNGGSVSVTTRSGNLDSPAKGWSNWSAAITDPKGGRIASPAARFIQWRANLRASSAGESPELDYVDVAYLPKNIEPHVDLIDMTPPNYKFPAPAAGGSSGPRQTMSLPALTRRSVSSAPTAPSESESTSTPTMQYAKGWVGARWIASDLNGDSMLYTVEIRGAGETQWKPLKDKLQEKYWSWDSTAYPDGEYRLRVTASDAPSNPPGEALSAQFESDPFLIDNTPPRITGLTAARAGGKLEIRWRATDALNNIARAEYSLDGGEWAVVMPVTKLSDSPSLDYTLSLDAAAGEHTIAIRVHDDYDNEAVEKTVVGR